jgi:hypothetical protein
MLRDFVIKDKEATSARALDSLFAGCEVHFLKLDVEGAEYELLKGARSQLHTNVLGVRSEVLFAPVYQGAPLFGELHRMMLDNGFELLNLDYSGAGNKGGRFTLPGRYGKLLSTDAVWVVGNDRLFAANGDQLMEDVVRLALFEMLNGATDLAIDTLLRAVTEEGVSFDSCRDDPLFMALHRKSLLHKAAILGSSQTTLTEQVALIKLIHDREIAQENSFVSIEDITLSKHREAQQRLEKHVLITGAGSFIGKHATAALARAGLQVTASFRSHSPVIDCMRKHLSQTDFTRLDLAREEDYLTLPKKVDAILHIAGLSATPGVTVEEMLACNVTGTRNLIKNAGNAKVVRVVVASTLSGYGDVVDGVITEATPVRNPGVYGARKYLAEGYLRRNRTGFHAFPIGAAGQMFIAAIVKMFISTTGSRSTVTEGAPEKSAFAVSSHFAVRNFSYSPMDIETMLRQYVGESTH